MESILSYATRDIKSMDGNIDEYKISGDSRTPFQMQTHFNLFPLAFITKTCGVSQTPEYAL